MPVVRILRVKKFDVVAKENNRKFNCKHVKLVMSAAGRGKVVYLTCDPPPLYLPDWGRWPTLHNGSYSTTVATLAPPVLLLAWPTVARVRCPGRWVRILDFGHRTQIQANSLRQQTQLHGRHTQPSRQPVARSAGPRG